MLLILSAVLVLCLLGWDTLKPRNYPPGPRWYPFFGCNIILHSRIAKYGSQWKAISEMAKEYSTDVLGLKLGNEKVVVVFGDKNIRQVSFGKEFDARPDSFLLRLRTLEKRIGVTFVDGPLWKEHKVFTFRQMRNEGFGSEAMHEEIRAALNPIFTKIDQSKGDPINIRTLIKSSVINIVWKYMAGEHMEDIVKVRKIIKLIGARSKVFPLAGGCLSHLPWLRFIAPEWSGYRVSDMINQELTQVIEDAIRKHKNGSISGNDYMHSYLNQMDRQKETYTEEQLKGVCIDILNAAGQTTGHLLDFAIIAAIHHSDVQDKMYEEITKEIRDKEFTWKDTKRLVYTSAFLLEVSRYYTVAPFPGPRRALVDVAVGPHRVPAGSTVLASLGDLHRDRRVWDEPQAFRPERFIDDDGSLKRSTCLHAFGVGRRKCPGEVLAKPFLLRALVELVRRYRIQSAGAGSPSDAPDIGMLSAPRPFDARFIARDISYI